MYEHQIQAISNPPLRHLSETVGYEYFIDALKYSFRCDDRGPSYWVKSYYAALLLSGKKKFRVFIVLDQTSVMIFPVNANAVRCCIADDPRLIPESKRISLLHIVNISVVSGIFINHDSNTMRSNSYYNKTLIKCKFTISLREGIGIKHLCSRIS